MVPDPGHRESRPTYLVGCSFRAAQEVERQQMIKMFGGIQQFHSLPLMLDLQKCAERRGSWRRGNISCYLYGPGFLSELCSDKLSQRNQWILEGADR